MGDVIEILTTATNTVEVEAQGPQGIPGVGVPTGGSTGQVLRKASGTDYDTEWAAAGSGSGSVTSVALASTDLTISGSPITDSGTITANLGNTGVTAGTYTKVTVDAKGRVTTGATATASDVGAAPATGIDPTAITGTAVVDSDPRLSDARTPSSTLAHSSSHHTGGTDAIAPNEISAAWALETRQHSFFSTSAYTLAQGRNVQLNVSIPASGETGTITLPRLTTDSAQNGDDVFVVLSGTMDGGQTLVIERYIWTGSSYIGSTETVVTTTTTGAWRFRLLSGQWALQPVASHTHGNITNGGLVGTVANLPLKTGTGGIVEAGVFGTGAGEFAEGNHTHANLHTRSHAITSTSDHTAGNHKVFYSNGSGEIVELALGNSGEVLTSNGATSAPSFAAASGGGVTTGSVDNAIIRANGTGGSTSQSSDLVIDDATTSTQNNVALVNNHSETNSALVLTPKGTGAFIVGPKPDGTSTGGGIARGSRAINIALNRTSNTQVASGTDSIAIGNTSSASGTRSLALGVNTNCSAIDSSAVGYNCSTTGSESVSIGVSSNASASNTVAIGWAAKATGTSAIAIGPDPTASATNAFAVGPSVTVSATRAVGLNAGATLRAQFSALPFSAIYWGGSTTNNTATVLNLDGTATNRFTIAANTALAVDILLVARRSDTADKWLVARRFLGIRRDGSNNTSLIGAVQTIGTDQSEGSPSWSFTLTADDTNEALQLEVTGATSETVVWRATAFYRVA